MNVGAWLIWGFAATVVLTMVMSGSQSLNLTRMNVPYLVGSMFTSDRDKAKLFGIPLHLLNGFIFSAVYVAAFHASGNATWWFGAAIGAVHGAFVLTVALPVMPAMHPRMAREFQGPTAVRRLEPPGFLGLHYGVRTPASVMVAHVIFGAIIGGFYHLS